MSFPIVFLSMEYLVASSKALWAKPTAPAATCQYKQVNQTFVCIGSLTQLPWNMLCCDKVSCHYYIPVVLSYQMLPLQP